MLLAFSAWADTMPKEPTASLQKPTTKATFAQDSPVAPTKETPSSAQKTATNSSVAKESPPSPPKAATNASAAKTLPSAAKTSTSASGKAAAASAAATRGQGTATAGKPAAAKAEANDAIARARDAFARADLSALIALESRTGNDPLAPYVTAWRLTLQILRGETNDAEVQGFLRRHGDDALGERIRRALAQAAVREGRWGEALQWSRAILRHDPSSRCWLGQAQMMTAPTAEAIAPLLRERLAAMTRLPSDCAPWFEAALALGHLPREWLEERFLATLFEAGWDGAQAWAALANSDSAAHLRQRAQRHERTWRQTPAAALAARDEALAYAAALVLAARDDPEAVHEAAARLNAHSELRDTVRRAAFVAAARQHLPVAVSWSETLPDSTLWVEAQRWKIRLALQAQDWARVLARIEALPDGEGQARDWIFWRGWAHQALGQTAMARQWWQRLAERDDYVGLLAQELLGRPWQVPQFVPPSGDLAIEPVTRRVLALRQRGWDNEAAQEIDALAAAPRTPQSLERLRATAQRLHEREQYDLGVRLLERAEDWAAVPLRYPLPWRATVTQIAAQEGVDPAWAYGVMRQESRFRTDARSSSGALGLMQVMPATGKWIAEKLGERQFRVPQLLEPSTNLRYGITYLRWMHERFDGHPVFATGAYNAGPGRIGRLQARHDIRRPELLEALLYVELLPIDETRGYVKNVLANTVVYAHLLGRPARLSELLLPFADAATQLSALTQRLEVQP